MFSFARPMLSDKWGQHFVKGCCLLEIHPVCRPQPFHDSETAQEFDAQRQREWSGGGGC